MHAAVWPCACGTAAPAGAPCLLCPTHAGRRNYGAFVMFLCSTCASLAVVLISGLTLPTHIKHLGNVDPNTAGLFELLNTLVLIFCLVMAALLFSFTTYHVSLICSGQSPACCCHHSEAKCAALCTPSPGARLGAALDLRAQVRAGARMTCAIPLGSQA